MIQFLGEQASDTFAYKDLDFRFEPGIHSVTGVNGASKTSIFATLSQCLFNKNIKGIAVPDVNNNITNKPYEITVPFLKNGKRYEVTNSKKTGKITILEDGRDISLKRIPDVLKQVEEILGCDYATFKDLIYQSPDSQINLLDTDSDGERKRFINRILRLDELDHHLDRMKNKEKEIAGKNGRITNLQRQIETYENALTEPQEELEPVQTEHLERALVDIRADLDALKQEQAIKIESRTGVVKELAKAQQAQEAVATLSKLEGELATLTPPEEPEEELRARIAEMNEVKAADAVVQARCQDLIQRGNRFKQDQIRIVGLSADLELLPEPEKDLQFCQENLSKLRSLKGTKEAELAQKEKEKGSLVKAGSAGTCPTCGAGVDKDKFTTEIEQLTGEIAAVTELIGKCSESITKYTEWERIHQQRNKLQNEIARLSANPDSGIDVAVAEAELAGIQSRVEVRTAAFTFCEQALKVIKQRLELELRLVQVKGQIGETADVQEVNNYLQDLDARLAELRGLIEGTTLKMQAVEWEIEHGRNHNATAAARKELNRQIEENNQVLRGQLDASRKELQETEETLELVKTWVGILGSKGYRVHKIEKFLKSLNSSMRKYAEMLCNGRIQCHFYIDEEGEIAFTVTDCSKQVSWACWSAGEKARVKLACLFAVLELLEIVGAVSFNVLCLDEIFGSLDNDGKEGLFRVLDYLRDKAKGVYIIAHSDLTLPMTYDSVIRAEKLEDGTTQIKQ